MPRKINAKLILKLLHDGYSYREINTMAGASNRSIKAVIDRSREMSLSYEDALNLSEEDVYHLLFPERYPDPDMYFLEDYEYVHKELDKPGVTLKLLWQEYQRKVPHGKAAASYSKYCADYTAFVDTHEYTSHIEHKPADKAEVDWAGKTMSIADHHTGEMVKVYLFVSCLPYSQYVYVEPTLTMDMKSWISCNVHMLEYFGGIPRRIVCDNLKTGVISHPKEGDIVFNETYAAFAEHYVVAVTPTGVRKPRHKASVESSVGDATTKFIATLRNKTFLSLDELKKEVRTRLEEFNADPFQKRKGSRKSVFEEDEKPHLRPLPAVPFETADWVYNRKVMNDCHIVWQKNHYSVPYQYVGKYVDLKITERCLVVYYKNNRIAEHQRFSDTVQNKYSTHPEDMPKSTQFVEWDDRRIRQWAARIGPSTLAVIDAIFNSVKIKEQGYNPALSVLNISKKYGAERLEKASSIALNHYRSPRYKHITAILANSQDLIEERKERTQQLSLFSRGPEYYGGKNND